jgi:uncharacterized protein (DUF983 family)
VFLYLIIYIIGVILVSGAMAYLGNGSWEDWLAVTALWPVIFSLIVSFAIFSAIIFPLKFINRKGDNEDSSDSNK